MDTQTHPDPFHDALGHGMQRFAQVASSAVTGAQAYAYLKRTHDRTIAERDARAQRAIAEQIRAERDTARAQWAPALDRRWLQQADLRQTAQAWGGAMPYVDPAAPWHEPDAATAMRNCENRLRDLHPTAMARYDRLRGEGLAPADSMREAAFLFAYPPQARGASYEPRQMLRAGDGETLEQMAIDLGPLPRNPGEVLAEAQERRGRQILEALQRRARAQGSDPLGAVDQRIVLETVTNLPTVIIDRVVQTTRPAHPGQGPAGQAVTRGQPAARPWEQDFPLPIDEVLATVGSTAQAATSSATPAPAKPQVNAPGHTP